MTPKRLFICISAVLICALNSCKAQEKFGENYLQLSKTIALPNVKGRIDHMDINLTDQVVYLAALGNNTLEVISLREGKVLHTIGGLDEPQGVCYIPQSREVFIANGSGDCDFYSAGTFTKNATIHLSSDADNVRYDSAARKLYVGYGNGGIAVIDADTHKLVATINFPSHPEGFQLDKKNDVLFANLPQSSMIAVVDLKSNTVINNWKITSSSANFPLAFDSGDYLLFGGFRHPANVIILDSKSGKQLGKYDIVSDADDIFYDAASARLFVSGGGGSINIFQKQKDNTLKQIANISTAGGARTSLLIPQLNYLLVAERAHGGQNAQLLVYRTTNK